MGKAAIPPPQPDPLLWKQRIRDLESDLGLPSYGRTIEQDDDMERRRRLIGVPPQVSVLSTINLVGGFIAMASSIAAAAWWLMDTYFPIVPSAFLGGPGF